MNANANADETWMQAALDAAKKGRPSPNPQVGAVVVKDGVVIGTGFHEAAGDAHAEIRAIAEAGERAKGGTLYVTLEPCNHEGKTPPCTKAILRAGITRVVIGTRDPNPNVAGGGLEALKSKGIDVVAGVLEKAAIELIRHWTKYVTVALPFLSLKLALSLDGRIATRTGSSKWVTGKVARAKVHALRAKNDAIAVGIGTVLADDPRLTVREVVGKNPLRIAFDTKLRLPLQSQFATTARKIPTWVLAGETEETKERAEALAALGVRTLFVPTSAEGRVDLRLALEQLAQEGIVSLMVEGGAELAGSILAAELADELHAFIGPKLFGPRGRPGAVDWAGPTSPEVAPKIRDPKWELCGEDAYVHGTMQYSES
jgi:diaminohydroxyphosphoribosylaminopyrimidine deaminase / 5-amino-6-(5-phosphoribosylamino)uracil reductase